MNFETMRGLENSTMMSLLENSTTPSTEYLDSILCGLMSDVFPTEELRKLVGFSGFYIVIATTLFIMGCVGNTLTIYKITCDSRLRKPVYILLRCLATADLFSLIVRYLLNFTTFQLYLKYCKGLHFPFLYDFLFYGTHHNSIFHIVILAGYRLFLVAKPIKCQRVITIRKIIVGSSASWIISFGIATLFSLATKWSHKESEVNLVYSGYTLFVPCFFIIMFHFLKLRKARNTEHVCIPSNIISLSNAIRRKMSIVICVIISFYSIPCVFDLIWFTLYLLKPNHMDVHIPGNEWDTWIKTIGKIGSLTWLLNYAVNPIIYFFYSKQVRLFLLSKVPCSKY